MANAIEKIKVGILGGAFDPITVGHVKLAEFILDKKLVDRVWITPCYQHRFKNEMAAPDKRLAMCRIATKNKRHIGVSDVEIEYRLTGETYNLINQIKKNAITERLYDFSVIVGQDNANTLDEWYRYEDLCKMVRFIVVPRKGCPPDNTIFDHMSFDVNHIIINEETDIPDISSTEIRKHLLYANKSSSFLKENLSEEVLNYILRNKLYSGK